MEKLHFFSKGSGKKQTCNNFYKNSDTFEFTKHVSVVQRPSSVESRINLKLHFIARLLFIFV